MTVRFLADEDLDVANIRGLRSREPAIDILDVKSTGLRGTKDPVLLEMAAEQGRILVTHDRNTMTAHFWDRLAAGKSSPGLFVVSDRLSDIGTAIEWLLLVLGRISAGRMARPGRVHAELVIAAEVDFCFDPEAYEHQLEYSSSSRVYLVRDRVRPPVGQLRQLRLLLAPFGATILARQDAPHLAHENT